MSERTAGATGAPLRVVVFTGGPVLEDACVDFIRRIEAMPGLDLAGVFCETRATGRSGIVRDLFRRRRWLAPALLLQRMLRRLARMLFSPARERNRRRTLRHLANRIHFVSDLHAEATIAKVAALRPAVGAVYGGPILRPQLFALPPLGTIGIHHGLLPCYRGKKTTFWAVHNGEPEVGVAIQRIGSGLDRGDVLGAATLAVGRTPLPALVRELERLGLNIYLETLCALQRGEVRRRPQSQHEGPLFKDPTTGEIIRFWIRDLGRLAGWRRPRPARSTGP
jgi:folate-dependent phosphoribosylglycinamide formyltransferase PurN